MKKILIINGSGGVGKDTFVNCLSHFAYIRHISIADPAKRLATAIGWDGGKSETDRKFLSDLKKLIDDYNDYNFRYIAKAVNSYNLEPPAPHISFLCIDMREKAQIERAKSEFKAETVLVKRSSVKHITSNMADAGVFDFDYDYYINNDGTIDDLNKTAKQFVKTLVKKEVSDLMCREGADKSYADKAITDAVLEAILNKKVTPIGAALVLLHKSRRNLIENS